MENKIKIPRLYKGLLSERQVKVTREYQKNHREQMKNSMKKYYTELPIKNPTQFKKFKEQGVINCRKNRERLTFYYVKDLHVHWHKRRGLPVPEFTHEQWLQDSARIRARRNLIKLNKLLKNETKQS